VLRRAHHLHQLPRTGPCGGRQSEQPAADDYHWRLYPSAGPVAPEGPGAGGALRWWVAGAASPDTHGALITTRAIGWNWPAFADAVMVPRSAQFQGGLAGYQVNLGPYGPKEGISWRSRTGFGGIVRDTRRGAAWVARRHGPTVLRRCDARTYGASPQARPDAAERSLRLVRRRSWCV